MDVQMPVMNGYDATKHIRKQLGLKSLPILAMTAYATTGEAEKTIIAGMNDYISKPFNPLKLYEKIIGLTHYQFDENELPSGEIQVNVAQTTAMPEQKQVTDLSFLRSATDNDTDLMGKMLAIMLREVPDELEKMERYHNEKNWERLGAVAHKFKSALTYMGLSELQEVLKSVQLNAQERRELDGLAALINIIKTTCIQAVAEMEEELRRIKY